MNDAQKAALEDLKEAVKSALPMRAATLNPEGTGRMRTEPPLCEYEAQSVLTLAGYVKNHTEASRILANSVVGLRPNQQCYSHAAAVAHLIELAEAQTASEAPVRTPAPEVAPE